MSDSTPAPHPTSIAVWDVPSPVVAKSAFMVRVGMKCRDACPLTGQRIVVRDETQTDVGEAGLGETPWPGTSALYAAEVTLTAPDEEGVYAWSVTFPSPLGTQHEEASTPFTFRAAPPPEHRFTVTVVDSQTQLQLANAQIRLGVYRTATDAGGQARLEVPKGRYALDIRRVGYETLSKTVDVRADVAIQIEALSAPVKDSDDEQVWM